MDTSNSVNTATTTTTTTALKESESDSSNDGPEQTAKTVVNDVNNSDEASDYFTEERVNTSVEDVSTLLPPITRDYSSLQADNNSCDSNSSSSSSSSSSLEIKLGLTILTDDPVTDAAKARPRSSVVLNESEKQTTELDNVKPSEDHFQCFI